MKPNRNACGAFIPPSKEEMSRFAVLWADIEVHPADVGQAFGITEQAVYARVRRHGLPRRINRRYGPSPTGGNEHQVNSWPPQNRYQMVPGPKADPWTAEMVNLLKMLWNRPEHLRLTLAQMAFRLGVTKSAMIGKKNRMERAGTKFEHRPTRRRKMMLSSSYAFPDRKGTSFLRRKAGSLPQEEALTGGVRFRDAKIYNCRWIAGNPKAPDVLCCGAYAEISQPYCAYHMGRAYRGR